MLHSMYYRSIGLLDVMCYDVVDAIELFIFTSCPIKVKLISDFGRFYTNSGAKFHSNPTTDGEFPHIPPF